jgi:hypothetical protein
MRNIIEAWNLPWEDDRKQLNEFDELKRRVQNRISLDVVSRLKVNPNPSQDEWKMGAFAEMWGPQVRSAVFELWEKGYNVMYAGFGTKNIQKIDGLFKLDEVTKKRLAQQQVNIKERPDGWTFIEWEATEADMELIKNGWQEIVALIPGLETQSNRSDSMAAVKFQMKYRPCGL